MTGQPSPTARELEIALGSARQAIEVLRAQAKAGRLDMRYLDQRLQQIESTLTTLDAAHSRADQAERLAKLYEVSRLIGSSLDLQTVLDQVMDAIIRLTGAERGFLVIQDDEGKLTVTVARNFDRETIDPDAVELSTTVTNRVLTTGQPIVTTNALEDPRFASQRSVIAHSLRSIMASPLRVRGQVIGVIYVDNRGRTGWFTEQDLNMLDAFAGQAAVAIDNARLFGATDQALQARVEELLMLQKMDRELNETLDVEKAMSTTLEWSIRVCGAQSASIMLLDVEEKTPDGRAANVPAGPRIVSHIGEADLIVGPEGQITHDPLLHQAIENREALLDQLPPGTGGELPRQLFIVPIRREDRAIGAITMTAVGDSTFTPEARALVVRMADRAAIAIDNARLHGAVRAANNAKSEFVAVVAHELKAPMTSISGYAELLEMTLDLTERQQGFINIIKNAVQRMKLLVSDLNDIGRIETGQLRIEPRRVSAEECLRLAIEDVATEIDRRGHRLEVQVAEGLPAVWADQDRVQQVLLNLLSNAYKYTPDGGMIHVNVRVNAHNTSPMVEIAVADSGIGMTPEQLARLGTKFWRAENGLQQPGTGLGFAITRHLVELMGGRLDVQSVVGVGTTVTFSVPISSA